MTSTPASEVPLFRGKTLTPESPVPLHIPEPANIPVLQNQIVPIFNLMSTHVDQPSSSGDRGTEGSSAPPYEISNMTLGTTGSGGAHATPDGNNNIQEERDDDGDGDNDYIMALENEELLEEAEQQSSDTLPNLSSSSLLQPSTPAASHETHSVPTQNDPSLSSPGQPQDSAGVPLQHGKSPPEPPQNHFATIGQSTTTAESQEESNAHMQKVDTDVNDGGVNYQALLDNLSPSAAAATDADKATITTVVPPERSDPPRPGSAESPLAALPVPAGLPPRPPPQDKPAIHPNYTPGEDIRSYHYTHTQNSNAHTSYSSQSSNPYRPSQGYPHPASTATVGANGLPPPPLATFQQPPAKAAQPQRSPLVQQSRPNDGNAKNGERSAVSADEGEDEVPWDQEVARKYAEFLRDEAVYVTEGLWDRFPQGSRLFVGMVSRLFNERATHADPHARQSLHRKGYQARSLLRFS
jgi:hypothetical protein